MDYAINDSVYFGKFRPNNKDKLFAWAASKDPLKKKKATAKFLEGKAWYWWVGYALLLWALASVVVSLISVNPH